MIPTIRYAVHSKKGFSRVNPSKPNQDNFLVKENTCQDNVHLFAVMDGHGVDGHHCAQFIAKDLPLTLEFMAQTGRATFNFLSSDVSHVKRGIINSFIKSDMNL